MKILSFDIPPKENETGKNLLTVQDDDHNISEGGEFLDDALRMIEQPLIYTEESIAAGSPSDLF